MWLRLDRPKRRATFISETHTVRRIYRLHAACAPRRGTSYAAYSIGRPCPADRDRFAKEQAAMQPATVIPVSATATPARPGYCTRAGGTAAEITRALPQVPVT
jgi:hypothetical protein